MEKKYALNGIRGLMAVAIVLSHCGYLQYYEQTQGGWRFVRYGYGAVTFFFVLSGYFFPYTYRKESFKSFMGRKMKKLYPLHMMTLLCSVCLMYYQGKLTIREKGLPFLMNILLLQSWIPNEDYYFSFNAVSWFLSALLFCYFAGYILFRSKREKKLIVITVILGYGLQIVLCLICAESHHWLLYINPMFRFVDFCLGILLCNKATNKLNHIYIYIYTVVEIGTLILFGLAVYLAERIDVNWTWNCIFVIPVACIIVVFSMEKGMLSKLFGKKCFQVMGLCSMELFMTHKYIVNNLINVPFFIRLASTNAVISLILILLLCFGLAGGTHIFMGYIKGFRFKGKQKYE